MHPYCINKMPKQFSSQWDFGDLFEYAARPQNSHILTVSELTEKIKSILEREFTEVWVRGEISTLKLHQASGHMYFELKDNDARISCIIFRGQEGIERDLLRDGQQIVVYGRLTVFPQKGEYRLIVRNILFEGLGKLMLELERLKRKLAAEGLLDPSRKRPIPPFPTRIGLVTSLSGAAIRDVIRILSASKCNLEIILAPCRVQGAGAAQEIAYAIQLLNRWHRQMVLTVQQIPEELRPTKPGLDLILVTRGGGSMEDLWAFNEEVVARAIAASAIPVISAVGHETDWTISDLVADLRAPTPTAAANIIIKMYTEAEQHLEATLHRILTRAKTITQHLTKDLRSVALQLRSLSPRREAELYEQRFGDLADRLFDSVLTRVRVNTQELLRLQASLQYHRPANELRIRQQQLDHYASRLTQITNHALQKIHSNLDHLASKLQLLGPMQTLARGYSITFDAISGKIIRSAEQLRPGQTLRTKFLHGQAISRVESTEIEHPDQNQQVST